VVGLEWYPCCRLKPACPAFSGSLDLLTRIIFGEYKLLIHLYAVFSTLPLLLSVLGLLSPQHFVHKHSASPTIVNSSHRLRLQIPLPRKKKGKI